MIKKIPQIASSLILIYTGLIFLFPEVGRLRYFLLFSVFLVIAFSFQLKKLSKIYFFVEIATISLVFLKIIPTPYLYLFNCGLPMSISIIFSVVSLSVLFGLVASLSAFIYRKTQPNN